MFIITLNLISLLIKAINIKFYTPFSKPVILNLCLLVNKNTFRVISTMICLDITYIRDEIIFESAMKNIWVGGIVAEK